MPAEYPPEWDKPEPVYVSEYVFSHCDVLGVGCNGSLKEAFVPWWSKEWPVVPFMCDTCGCVAGQDELEAGALEVYGQEWERFCRVVKEQPDESWDY